MLTTLLTAAALWLALAVPAAVLLGRAIATADREQAAHRAAAALRNVA